MTADASEKWSKGTLPLLVGVQTCTATMGVSVAVPQKDENQSISRSSKPTLRHICKRDASFYYGDPCSPMLIAALFMTARNWEQPRCLPAGEGTV